MENKIAILTSGHPPLDERIFWKFAYSLSAAGYKISVISSTEELKILKENILINSFNGNSLSKRKKINTFYKYLSEFKPDLIICCEPLVIISAYKYKKQYNKNCVIISDITEHYPNKNTLKLYSGSNFILKYTQLFLFNVYATNLADCLIIGEDEKARLYKYIAPFKRQTTIGYYPPLKLFNFYLPQPIGKKLTLCYTGGLTNERGFYRFSELIKKFAALNSGIIITAKIIGDSSDKSAKQELESLSQLPKVNVEHKKNVNYESFGSEILSADICIDLRDKNSLFNHSLPIKIFDYMACGKPVIFSNLKSFYQLPEVEEVGFLVDPDNLNSALQKILLYIKNPGLLIRHSKRGRELAETRYNWELLSGKLLKLVSELLTPGK